MTTHITIIGLRAVGASIGLGLAEYGDVFLRTGFDYQLGKNNQAKKLGAVDKVSRLGLPVKELAKADIVVLALPLNQVQEALSSIAPELKEGAILLDTAPGRAAAGAWAQEIMPSGRHYLGFTPTFNPGLLSASADMDAVPHADLFVNAIIAITANSKTPEYALSAAAGLAEKLGAIPLFSEPEEVDSLVSATGTIPQLLAAALVNALVNRPGWKEGRKFAGHPFAAGTESLLEILEPAALAGAAVLDKNNLVKVLDDVFVELQRFRQEIEDEDIETLALRVLNAQAARNQWWRQRQEGNWPAFERPKVDLALADFTGNMFGFSRKSRQNGE
ncbi:MAG: prephenate dehydrogenase/arogenate dehydrogenase family protein [Anaerolineae bacterium]|nr:prephenate dehydrogenase/arogenate dehydrogenase family protein [Anaerolineae bacterium]